MKENLAGEAPVERQVRPLVERLRTDVLWHRRRGNETIARDCQEAADEIERLRQALRDIADPFAAWRRDLPEGHALDGAMCVCIANDPETYRRMAREALKA